MQAIQHDESGLGSRYGHRLLDALPMLRSELWPVAPCASTGLPTVGTESWNRNLPQKFYYTSEQAQLDDHLNIRVMDIAHIQLPALSVSLQLYVLISKNGYGQYAAVAYVNRTASGYIIEPDAMRSIPDQARDQGVGVSIGVVLEGTDSNACVRHRHDSFVLYQGFI